MNNAPPGLPDPDFVPQNWQERAAHYFQCVNALDHSTTEMRRHADCPRFGPVVGPQSVSGGKCVRAGLLLLDIMEQDLRELRRQGTPEPQRDVDALVPRVVKARRALAALL